MSKRNLQNEEFDKIAGNLFKNSKLNAAELENIVAEPHLFASVKARIRAEAAPRKNQETSLSLLFDFRNVFNLQRIAAASAVLIIAVFAGLFIIKQKPADELTGQKNQPQIEQMAASQIAQIVNSLPPAETRQTEIVPTKVRSTINRKTANLKSPKSTNGEKKTRREKIARPHGNQSPEVFYSLASAGHWEANGEDLRVVRAELSTSELFALGVNLPVGNEMPKIKTDLLVGANGVPKAIRFVE